jgi:gamma-glutamyltranspeptidase
MAKKQLETLIKPHGKSELETEIEPKIKMGSGFHLSVDEPVKKESAPEHLSTSTHVHKGTKVKKRKAPKAGGQRIYPENIRDLKQIALDENRIFYEVLNEAIVEYIARKRQKR